MKKIFFISLFLLVLITIIYRLNMMQSQNNISVGDRVPDFSLKDQFGNNFHSADYLGKTTMVIYFYPKDDTPGCTKEACKFRDSFTEFSDRNVMVVGISADNVDSHKKFAEKYNLPFTLLADTQNKVRKLFGVKSNILGLLPGRVTYIIDKEGNVKFIYSNMFNAEKHIEEVIKELNKNSI
jgi:peroxiredoxin Q/BCP